MYLVYSESTFIIELFSRIIIKSKKNAILSVLLINYISTLWNNFWQYFCDNFNNFIQLIILFKIIENYYRFNILSSTIPSAFWKLKPNILPNVGPWFISLPSSKTTPDFIPLPKAKKNVP